jgi:hypothetical protein
MITPLFTFDEGILNANDFSQASWSKTNVTLTPNATAAPDGSVTAMKVAATASAATTLSQTVNGAGKASGKKFFIYAKQGSGAVDGNSFNLFDVTSSTTILACTVNYGTGVVTYTTGAAGITMIALTGGWWLIIFDTIGLAIANSDNLAVGIGFVGNAETAAEFVYLWGASLRSIVAPSYPAVGKLLANQRTVLRHDSITSSGIKQSIVERTDQFNPLVFTFVPQADIPQWVTFMNYAQNGGAFTYYPDSTNFLSHTDYSLDDMDWSPKRTAFGHATFSIDMRVWV